MQFSPLEAMHVKHIEFSDVGVAYTFWQRHGGHLFVGTSAIRIVWFCSDYTPTKIFTSEVLAHCDGVLNPTATQLGTSTMTLGNPHKEGSVAHNHYAVFCSSAFGKSAQALASDFKSLKERAGNFLNLSASQMAELDFKADVYAIVFKHRFGCDISVMA